MGSDGRRKFDEGLGRGSCSRRNYSRRWGGFVAATTESLEKVTEFTKGISLSLGVCF
jgi:hypothetical protein